MKNVDKGESEEAEALGLTKKEFAFLEVVKKYLGETDELHDGVVKEDTATYISQDIIDLSKGIAQNVSDILEQKYMIDLTTNPTKTADIERAIYMMLTKKHYKKISLEGRKQLVQPLLQLAKKHYAKLD
ncbi:hypothetical protein [Cytobacillus pseudoceanisediminis]